MCKKLNIPEDLHLLAYKIKKYNTVDEFLEKCNPCFDILCCLEYKYRMYNWIIKKFYSYKDINGARCLTIFYKYFDNFTDFYNKIKNIELIPKNQKVANNFNKEYKRWLNIPANIDNSTDIRDYIRYEENSEKYMNKCKLAIKDDKFIITEPINL